MLVAVVAVLPLAQIFGVRALRDVVFLRGSVIGALDTAVASAAVLAPYCLASGCLLTLGCAVLVFSPGVRTAVAGFLGLRGARIEVTNQPPSGLVPTSLGVNPQVTIMALATRAAEKIAHALD